MMGSLIHMLFMRVTGVSRVQFGLGVTACNGFFLTLPLICDGLQKGVFEPFLLPWEHGGVDTSGFFRKEKDSCFLERTPLSWWDPNKSREGVLA